MNTELTVIFGLNAILEKLRASPEEVAEILVSGEAAREVETQARRLGVTVKPATRRLLDQLAGGGKHQGAVARIHAYRYGSIEEFFERTAGASPRIRVLILDGITDPRNFGALLRCADGAGAPHVVIPKDRSVSVTGTVIKASAGAAHHVQIYKVTNLRQAMKQMKDHGWWLVGLDPGAEAAHYHMHYPEKVAVVLGSEGKGLRAIIREECDFLVSIPMAGKVASLNVAVAGAVLLYEILRQSNNLENVDKHASKGLREK